MLGAFLFPLGHLLLDDAWVDAIAAWLGAIPSALIGGVGAIAVMVIWMFAFPQLRRVDKLAP